MKRIYAIAINAPDTYVSDTKMEEGMARRIGRVKRNTEI